MFSFRNDATEKHVLLLPQVVIPDTVQVIVFACIYDGMKNFYARQKSNQQPTAY